MSDKDTKADTQGEPAGSERQTEETTGYEQEASTREESISHGDEVPGRKELKPILDPTSSEKTSTSDVKAPIVQVSEVLSTEPSTSSLEFYVRDYIPQPPRVIISSGMPSKTRSESEAPSFRARPKKYTKKKKTLTRGPAQTLERVEEKRPKLSMIFVEGEEFLHKKQKVQEVSFENLAEFVQQDEWMVPLNDTMSRLYYINESKVLTDISFHIMSGPVIWKIEAHRSYLSVCSQIFDTIVKFCNENCITDMIFFGLEPRLFRLMIDFLYTDAINSLDEIELLELYEIGDKFLIDSLKVRCQNDLSIVSFAPENVLFVLKRVIAFRMVNIKFKCMKFIELDQTVLYLLQNEKGLRKNVLIEILKCPKLHIPSEMELLLFIMKWGEDLNVEKESLRDMLQDVVPYLRYDGLVASEFLELPDLEKVFTVQQIIDVILYMARQKKELPSWCSTQYAQRYLKAVKIDSKDPFVPTAEGTSKDPSVPTAEGTSKDPSVPTAEETSKDPSVPTAEGTSKDPSVPTAEGTSKDPSVPTAEGTSKDPSVPTAEGTSKDPSQRASKRSGKGPSRKQPWKASKPVARKIIRMVKAVSEESSRRKETEPSQDSSKTLEASDDVLSQKTLTVKATEIAADVAELNRQVLEQKKVSQPSLGKLREEVVKVTAKTLSVYSVMEETLQKKLGAAYDFQDLQLATTSEDVPDPEGTASADVFRPYIKTEHQKIKIHSAKICLPFSEDTETIHSNNTEAKFSAKCDGSVLILGVSLSFELQDVSRINVTATGSIGDELETVRTNTYEFEGVTNAERLLMLRFPEPFVLEMGFEFYLKVYIKFDIPRAITLLRYPTTNIDFNSNQPVTWTFSYEGPSILAGIYFTNEFTWSL